jgi:hypothetical protein
MHPEVLIHSFTQGEGSGKPVSIGVCSGCGLSFTNFEGQFFYWLLWQFIRRWHEAIPIANTLYQSCPRLLTSSPQGRAFECPEEVRNADSVMSMQKGHAESAFCNACLLIVEAFSLLKVSGSLSKLSLSEVMEPGLRI